MRALLASEATTTGVTIDDTPLSWVLLLGVIAALLLVDLLVLHREAHTPTFRRSVVESAGWIAIGLSFGLVMLWWQGGAAAGEYYAGYLVEKSLSVDNVFVWALIFTAFAIPLRYQHRVLFWGIFGALVLRAIFIFLGVAIIERFEWTLFLFGGFLVFTALRLVTRREDAHADPRTSRLFRLVARVVPSTPDFHGQHLFTRVDHRLLATPLFLVLILVEATDVVFAVDSIPAVLAVTRDQFIAFSSNAFAILGLRALYFLLAGAHARFSYLEEGLAVILAFVGVKMIVSPWYHIPTWLSLTVIFLVLTMAVLASLRFPADPGADEVPLPVEDVVGDGPRASEEPPPPSER